MNRYFWAAALAMLLCGNIPVAAAATPWGKDYFPNVILTTQDGESVRFFDDLIKDKVVAINFIYTTCPDICPLETAQLVKVQNILGDRMGKEVRDVAHFQCRIVGNDTYSSAEHWGYLERHLASSEQKRSVY